MCARKCLPLLPGRKVDRITLHCCPMPRQPRGHDTHGNPNRGSLRQSDSDTDVSDGDDSDYQPSQPRTIPTQSAPDHTNPVSPRPYQPSQPQTIPTQSAPDHTNPVGPRPHRFRARQLLTNADCRGLMQRTIWTRPLPSQASHPYIFSSPSPLLLFSSHPATALISLLFKRRGSPWLVVVWTARVCSPAAAAHTGAPATPR